MGLFDFLFKKTKPVKKVTYISTYANSTDKQHIHILTDNELEILKRVQVYKIGSKPQGIINAYHEDVPRLIRTFIERGLLVSQTKEDFINHLKVEELKEILRNRGLKISGRKSELVSRILSDVPEQDYAHLIDKETYTLSSVARKLLQDYEISKEQKILAYEKECINLILNKKIDTVYDRICKQKLNSVSGSMINWDNELKKGLDKCKEEKLIKSLNFTDSETDYLLHNNLQIFNACCIYCYLSGINQNDIIKIYSSYIDENIDNNIWRILRGRAYTWESYVISQDRKNSFIDLGVKYYKVVGTLDRTTCEFCGKMDGKIFEMSDYQPGITAPPFHQLCRCTTAPYFEDSKGQRAARDPITGKTVYVDKNMTYLEYKEKYLDVK